MVIRLMAVASTIVLSYAALLAFRDILQNQPRPLDGASIFALICCGVALVAVLGMLWAAVLLPWWLGGP